MANMGYCRFQNTLQDLQDCHYHLNEAGLSKEEKEAREALVKLCEQIVSDAGEEFEEDVCETCGYPQSECLCE